MQEGKSLLSVDVNGEVKITDLESGKVTMKFSMGKVEPYEGCRYLLSPDGRHLAFHRIGKDKQLAFAPLDATTGVLDLSQQKVLWKTKDRAALLFDQRLSFSQDGAYFGAIETDPDLKVMGLRQLRVGFWNVQTGKKIGAIGSKARRPMIDEVWRICLCDKANVLAIGLANGHIELWDLKTTKHLLDLTGHKGPVEALALSPDGHTLASGGSEGTIVLWDLRAATAQKRKGKGFSLLP
jgi:WD40 repeat protein